MFNLDNIFDPFSMENNPEGNEAHFDISQTPFYWVGMFKKLIINHKMLNSVLEKSLPKHTGKNLGDDLIENLSESVIHNMAYTYIKKIDISIPSHNLALERYKEEHLDVALKMSISFFEEIEEYEKCARLKKILDSLDVLEEEKVI